MNPGTSPDNEHGSVDKLLLADLRSLTSVDPSRFHRIVSLFLEAIAADLSLMRAAMAANDSARLEELAHGLKGTSANMGAARLAALCADMEQACESEQCALVEEQLRNIESEAAHVAAILTAEIAL